MKKTTIACIVTAIVVLGCVLAIGAATYVGVPKGQIYQAYVTYSDSGTIIIKPGYGECDGHYWENTSDLVYDVNYIPAGEDFIYIYIDDDESDYPYPTICDSITEPVWSDSKLGWYNGYDRCIGVVWTTSSGAAIKPFCSNSNQRYITDNMKTVISSGVPSGYQFLETSDYIPVNAKEVSVFAQNGDSDGYAEISVGMYGSDAASRAANSEWFSAFGYRVARLHAWLEIPRNSSRDMGWYGEAGDDSGFCMSITGYQIER